MKFYVANCTQQIVDFVYRLPETSSMRSQRIDIGSQIRISGDLSTTDIEAIIRQHAKYGLVAEIEIDRTKPFIGLCYSVDKPVSMEKVRLALHHNVEVLQAQGRKLRQEAALSVSNMIETQTDAPLKSLEMSVVEEDTDKPSIAEGTRVTRDATPDGTPLSPTSDKARTRSGKRRAA